MALTKVYPSMIQGGSGGGAKNFVTGGDAETGSIFATYKDAVQATPVDGAGGTPTIASATVTTTTPLSGLSSFLLTHPVSNAQGEGWSIDFTIDDASKAKVLSLSFDYIVNSGTFVPGTDLTVWIYDVTNAVLIQPSSFNFLSNSTTIADKFNATFQSASNSNSYRLIFHIASVAALAYVIEIDSIAVSPSTYVYGTPITDFQSWVPTGSWTTNTTYTGAYKKMGDEAVGWIKLTLTGAPNAVALNVNLPFTIDTAKIAATAIGTVNSTLGYGQARDTGIALIGLDVAYNSTTSLAVMIKSVSSTFISNGTQVTQAAPFTFGNTDEIYLTFRVPVVGWSSSVQMSDQTDTRVVVFRALGAALTSHPTTATFSQVLGWAAPTIDTHGAYSSNTYTVRVAGFYRVSAAVSFAASSTGSRLIQIYKNGAAEFSGSSQPTPSASNAAMVAATGVLAAIVGDTIRVHTYQDSGGALAYTAVAAYNSWHIERISGPSAIAASDSMSARYTSTTATAIGTSAAVLPFPTRDYDSHLSYNTTTGLYTSQTSGKFNIKAVVTSATVNISTSQIFEIYAYKNGVLYAVMGRTPGLGASVTYVVSGDTDVQLNAGDTLAIWALCSVATTVNTSAGYTHMSIKRVGN